MNQPPRLRDVTIGALATDPANPCTRWVIHWPAGFPCPWPAIPCTRWALWPLIHPLGAHGRIDSPAAACACDPAAACDTMAGDGQRLRSRGAKQDPCQLRDGAG